MILSGREIVKHIGKEIIIEPFDPKRVNPNSYNLSLANELLVYDEHVLDMKKPNTAHRIEIPEDEAYAANCIWVNGTVIVPEGYPAVLAAVQDAGYETITVDTSEYRKLDGGLSCLSLRF